MLSGFIVCLEHVTITFFRENNGKCSSIPFDHLWTPINSMVDFTKVMITVILYNFQMDGTPSSNRVLRSRHVPTPKFEERKKKLFGDANETPKSSSARQPVIREQSARRPVLREYDEDSDLGPISPLESSSSPTHFDRCNGVLNESTSKQGENYANILNGNSTDQKYSLKRLTVNLGRKVCIDSDDDDPPKSYVTTDVDSEDGVTPLCVSMEKMATDPPTPITTGASVFCDDQNYAEQMRTPSESTITTASGDQMIRGQSFRKALLVNAGLTPNEAESTAQLAKHEKVASIDRPKAKTSLIFNEPTISTKSFYGSSSTANGPLVNRFNSANDDQKFPMMSIISKFKKQSSTHRKQQSHKRPRWTGPSLWRNGGIHKPMRSKRRSKPAKHSKIERKALDTTTSSTSIDSDNNNPRSDKNERQQSILKDKNVSQIPVRAAGSTSDADSEYEDDDDDENDPLLKGIGILQEITKDAENNEPEIAANRKFFKSKASTTTKKYQIMNGLSATLKRGNDFKLELPAKRVRRSRGMIFLS